MILNKDDYLAEIHWQLDDRDFYAPLTYDPMEHNLNLVKVRVQEGLLLGYINKKPYDFLINLFPCVLVFYTLPKLHKGGVPPPVQPIILECCSVLEPLAK